MKYLQLGLMLFALIGCSSGTVDTTAFNPTDGISSDNIDENTETKVSDEDDDENDEDNEENDTTTTGTTTTTTPTTLDPNAKYMLTAWNDLGMHCMDGNDFSVFSVLPPYNNLHAQLKNKNGGIITSGVTLTYTASLGTDGKLNTTSGQSNNGAMKTNFWSYVADLFGATPELDIGLTGNPMATLTPSPMTFNASHQWWEAEGIPITPYNDDGTKNYYPLVTVTAKDSTGTLLAQVETVLPVSDEMDCKRCHASNSDASAKPTVGWVNDADAQKDYKYNILRLHDQNHPTAVTNNTIALSSKGYNYHNDGLEATAKAGTAILCVACHKSNALPNVGIEITPFTQAIHNKHANVIDPLSSVKLGDLNNRTACYACHPGADTKCLRGAMGDAKNADGSSQMQCQSCHGTMQSVGSHTRQGWLNQPNCQACHHDGKQETSAIDPAHNSLFSPLSTIKSGLVHIIFLLV